MPKRILKIGIELEGGWDKTFSDIVIQHDGSVHLPLTNHLGKPSKHYGEIPSPPFESMMELKEWLFDHYPTAVNSHCGFHVHISLKKNLYYSQLMDKAFFKIFRSEAEKWGSKAGLSPDDHFWSRIKGENKFCTTSFMPHQQAQIIVKEINDARRYTMWNFCYGMHGTAECRVAPQFPKAETAYSWVRFVVDMAEDYLAQRPPERVMAFRLKAKDLDIIRDVQKDYDSLGKKKKAI
jgi:hypothetical protein